MTSRVSGIQRDVFSLYRRVLRQALQKDRLLVSSSSSSTELSLPKLLQQSTSTVYYAVHEFRRQATSVTRSDFKRIEYLIRQGDKQIKLLNMPGVRRVVRTE